MRFELFIAKKIKTGSGDNNRSSTPILNIAVIGIVLAIIIMILSITIVCGFKKEIENKIYELDSHIKIFNASFSDDGINNKTVNKNIITPELKDSLKFISSFELVAEKPAILKTAENFSGTVFRGTDERHDWKYLEKCLISGRIPNTSDSINEIIISQYTANQLHLKAGDKIRTYFIDNKVKARNFLITGIFNTDFEDFDKTYILGSIKQIQQINGWDPEEGSYIGITVNDLENLEDNAYRIYSALIRSSYKNEDRGNQVYNVTNTYQSNITYFAWLDLLDMNVVIILMLMTIVSAFTMIAGLLIIVFGRINMIGILKALGAGSKSIRGIFIFLTQKLIFKALLIGNISGISLAYLQEKLHIVKLNPEAYYMSYVPIAINWWYLLLLNIGVILIAYITLLGPSYIISSIKPSKSIRFE